MYAPRAYQTTLTLPQANNTSEIPVGGDGLGLGLFVTLPIVTLLIFTPLTFVTLLGFLALQIVALVGLFSFLLVTCGRFLAFPLVPLAICFHDRSALQSSIWLS